MGNPGLTVYLHVGSEPVGTPYTALPFLHKGKGPILRGLCRPALRVSTC